MNKTKQAKKVRIAINEAIDFHNRENPDDQINLRILADRLKTCVQNLSNYNSEKQKTPEVMLTTFNIHLLTKYPIKELIKEVK